MVFTFEFGNASTGKHVAPYLTSATLVGNSVITPFASITLTWSSSTNVISTLTLIPPAPFVNEIQKLGQDGGNTFQLVGQGGAAARIDIIMDYYTSTISEAKAFLDQLAAWHVNMSTVTFTSDFYHANPGAVNHGPQTITGIIRPGSLSGTETTGGIRKYHISFEIVEAS